MPIARQIAAVEIGLTLGNAVVPAAHGVVIVGAGVGHAMDRVVMRQEGAVRPAAVIHAEAKLQDLHSWQAKGIAQLVHIRRDHAQVLGDDRQIAQAGLDGAEEIHPRRRHPTAISGCLGPAGHLPVGAETAEMIDAHDVHLAQHGADALQPPSVAGSLVHLPAVKRVTPQLAAGRIIVRRHPGNHSWAAFRVQEEKLRVGPDIRAVMGDEDRDIADDLDLALARSLVHRIPLAEENELAEGMPLDRLGVLAASGSQRLRLAIPKRRLPGHPGRSLMSFFQRHEQGKILQPGALLSGERPRNPAATGGALCG